MRRPRSARLTQIISGESYDPITVDIWSSGITLFAMLCGYLPFDDESKTVLYNKILSCQFKIPKYVSPAAADLISKILVCKVSERLTLDQIRAHPWMSLHQPQSFANGYFFSGGDTRIPVGSCC